MEIGQCVSLSAARLREAVPKDGRIHEKCCPSEFNITWLAIRFTKVETSVNTHDFDDRFFALLNLFGVHDVCSKINNTMPNNTFLMLCISEGAISYLWMYSKGCALFYGM